MENNGELETTELAAPEAAETAAPEKKKKRGFFKKEGKRPGKKKKFKKWIILLVVVAAIAAGIVGFLKYRAQKSSDSSVSYVTAKVERQDIDQTLDGTGTLEPADSYTVTSLISGEVLTDTFEEGDTVTKGDVLYTLDSSSAVTSQTQAQNSYKSAQNSYEQAVAAKYPKADISGTITAVNVSDGDSIQSGSAICTIVGSNSLVIDFYFTDVPTSSFYIGESANVYFDIYENGVTGKVTAVSSKPYTANNSTSLTTVRVKLDNPGTVTTSATATAEIGGYSSYGDSTVTYSNSSTVYATGSGIVKNMNLLLGNTVKAGDTLCTISGTSIDNQIENSQISLDNAKTSVSNSKDTLDNYTITAPISGKVVQKNVKAGDNLNNASSSTGMAVIYDLSYLQIEMAIDELDISQVKEGQTVTITADAVDGTFTGYVSKVSIDGTTTNGVTTYPVTVILKEYGDLLPGMNVNASIMVSEVSDVLAVPNEAVNRGNTVLVTSDSPSAANALTDQTAPDGYAYVQVETGTSNDDYIEITSGLQEGDTVAYAVTSSDTSTTSQQNMMMGGMAGGGGGGGAPSGGPSDGGGGNMGGGPQG